MGERCFLPPQIRGCSFLANDDTSCMVAFSDSAHLLSQLVIGGKLDVAENAAPLLSAEGE